VRLRVQLEAGFAPSHLRWSGAVAARHTQLVQRWGWHPLDLVFRVAVPARFLNLSEHHSLLQLHFAATFLKRIFHSPRQVAPPLSAPDLRAPKSGSPLPTRVEFLRLLQPIPRTGLNDPRSFAADRLPAHFSPFPLASVRPNAQRASLGTPSAVLPARFALLDNAGALIALGERVAARIRRTESAYIPVTRSLTSHNSLASNSAGANPSGPWPKSSSASFAAANAQPKTSSPQLDIRKVTEEVIQQIDRRIVATRERFGKI
jgi:hypothetical protein